MYICIRGINLKIFTVMGGLLLFDPLKCVFVLLLNPTINFIACVGAVTLKKTTTATVHHPIYSNHHVFWSPNCLLSTWKQNMFHWLRCWKHGTAHLLDLLMCSICLAARKQKDYLDLQNVELSWTPINPFNAIQIQVGTSWKIVKLLDMRLVLCRTVQYICV